MFKRLTFIALGLWTLAAISLVPLQANMPGTYGVLVAISQKPNIGTPVSIGSSISTPVIKSSWTLTTTATVPASALIVVCTQHAFGSAQTITSITDGGFNTYTNAVTNAFDASTQLISACYYKENANQLAAGSIITVTLSANTLAQPSILNAAYVTGVIGSGSLDKTNSGLTSNGTAYASGTTGVLAQANEIAIGFVGMYNGNATITEGAGFTNINTTAQGSGSFYQSRMSRQIVAATTALNYQPSASLNTFGKTLIATFKGY